MAIDNTLLGSYDKEGSNVKEAVYRVKNAGDDGYVRVHFETNSKMIHDATDAATGHKVARRNKDGDITFNKTTSNSLEVTTTSNLKGNTSVGGTLTVADNKTTTLGGSLTVKGESNFNSITRHNAGATVKGTLRVEAGSGVNGDLNVGGNSNLTGTLSVASTTALGNTLTAAGATTLNDTLTVGKVSTLNGGLVVNANSTLGKADNTNTTTINGTAAVNKLTVKDTGLVANLNADRVDNRHVNDDQVSTGNLWTAQKIDTVKADKTVAVTTGTGLKGGGTLAASFSITHDTTARTDTTPAINTGGTTCNVIKSIGSNSLGHITTTETVNLDSRFANKSVSITGSGGLTGGGTLEANRTITHSEVGRTNTTTNINTSGAGCNVLRNITSNNLGHVTAAETINLDNRFANKANSISAGTGLSGGGTLEASRTISHATQSVPSPTLGAVVGTVISNLTVTNLGHVTGIGTTNLDERYPSYSRVAEDIANAGATVSKELLAKNPQPRTDNGNKVIMANFSIEFNNGAIEFIIP